MVLVFCTSSHLHLLLPNLIPIPFVLSKIWQEQAIIMKNKWLWEDNSVKIQGMVIVQCNSSY